MTDQQPNSAPPSLLPAGRTRIQFNARIESLAFWSGSTPDLTVKVEYDEGDREKAIDLLQGIVDAARAETKAPERTVRMDDFSLPDDPGPLVEKIARKTGPGWTAR